MKDTELTNTYFDYEVVEVVARHLWHGVTDLLAQISAEW